MVAALLWMSAVTRGRQQDPDERRVGKGDEHLPEQLVSLERQHGIDHDLEREKNEPEAEDPLPDVLDRACFS